MVLQVPLPDGTLGSFKGADSEVFWGKKMDELILRCFFFKDAVRFQLHFMNP